MLLMQLTDSNDDCDKTSAAAANDWDCIYLISYGYS